MSGHLFRFSIGASGYWLVFIFDMHFDLVHHSLASRITRKYDTITKSPFLFPATMMSLPNDIFALPIQEFTPIILLKTPDNL